MLKSALKMARGLACCWIIIIHVLHGCVRLDEWTVCDGIEQVIKLS